MPTTARRAIACIGFMGAGKTTAARSAADALGTEAIDVDAVIEKRAGKPIDRLFDEDGEAAFRALEEQVTLELLNGSWARVLSLGGGAIGSDAVRRALSEQLVIWLDVDPETAWRRAQATARPLARSRPDFERLYVERQPLYESLADVTVPSERSQAMPEVLGALESLPADTKVLWAASASGDYPVYVGSGLLQSGFWPPAIEGRRFLVTDGGVARLYAESVQPVAGRIAIMPGEPSKTVAPARIALTRLPRA